MAADEIGTDGEGGRREEPEGFGEQEHHGGGRFNRLILIGLAPAAIVSSVVVALGVESSGSGQSALQKPVDDPGASARNNSEIADLAERDGKALTAPAFVPLPALLTTAQTLIQQSPPRPPSRFAQ